MTKTKGAEYRKVKKVMKTIGVIIQMQGVWHTKRAAIRDSRSDKKVKPRVMDVLIDDDGTKFIEVKDGNTKKTILLDDFERQVAEITTWISDKLPSNGSEGEIPNSRSYHLTPDDGVVVTPAYFFWKNRLKFPHTERPDSGNRSSYIAELIGEKRLFFLTCSRREMRHEMWKTREGTG